MRPNEAKQRLLAGQPAIGIFISAQSPLVAEAVGRTGLSWVCVDMQHGETNLGALSPLLAAISATPAMPYARVPYNDFKEIGRALDLGAYGIIVPLVNTPAEAAAAVRAAKYPPLGARSMGPIRGAIYGGENYFAESNDEIALFAMIETAEAVGNLGEIVATDGIDGCYIGPNDLAISYGVAPGGDSGTPLAGPVEEAIATVLATCQAAGKAAGIHVANAGAANRRLRQGFRFVSINSEVGIMRAAIAAEYRGLSGGMTNDE
jgi:4-hydroxy-2-oxoheptanedioate aldolase